MTDEMRQVMISEIERAARTGKMRGLAIAQRQVLEVLGKTEAGNALVKRLQALIDSLVGDE